MTRALTPRPAAAARARPGPPAAAGLLAGRRPSRHPLLENVDRDRSGFRLPDHGDGPRCVVRDETAARRTSRYSRMRFTRPLALGALALLATTLAVPAASASRLERQALHRDRLDQLRGAGHRLEHLGRRAEEGRLPGQGGAGPGHAGHRGAGHREGPDQPRARLRGVAARVPARRQPPGGRRTTSPRRSRPTRRHWPPTA